MLTFEALDELLDRSRAAAVVLKHHLGDCVLRRQLEAAAARVERELESERVQLTAAPAPPFRAECRASSSL